MLLITERTLVQSVAKRWAQQYSNDWGRGIQAIATALSALDGETATAADVARIIGNDSWCEMPTCHECGKTVDAAVQLGEEPDYESNTATVCLSCLQKAVALIIGSENGSALELAAKAPTSFADRR